MVVADTGLEAPLVERFVARARPALAACGQPGRSVRVSVQLHFAFGDVGLAAPAPENPGPPDVARCVAGRIRQAVPPELDPEESGIVFVDVTLPAR